MMRVSRLLVALAVCHGFAGAANAQLMLPGAVNQTPAGTNLPPAEAGKPQQAAPTAVLRAPGEETLLGRQLQRNGSIGLMAFERGKTLELSRLVLVGEQIDRPYEACRVEISGGKIPIKPAPATDGLHSFDVNMEACPFSIDVLDGAVRVRGGVCQITAAACRVDPAGVWGPPGARIGAEEAKTIEHLRTKAEKDARDLFRALLASTGTDRAKQRRIVSEQAGFSSRREEMCRDYAGEDKHGFCASRITLARAVALSAELHGAPAATAKPAPKKPAAPRPRPVSPPVASQAQPGGVQ